MTRLLVNVVFGSVLALLYFQLIVLDAPVVPLCATHPLLCKPIIDSGHAPNDMTVGRWRQPTLGDVHERRVQGVSLYKEITQLKKWSWLSFANEDFFIGGAIVELNYVSEVFFYIVDLRTNGNPMYEFSERSPLSLATEFAPSSTHGCTRFAHVLEMCATESGWAWRTLQPLQTTDGKQTLDTLQMFVDRSVESLVFTYPTREHGTAYVHKSAGNQAILEQLSLRPSPSSSSPAATESTSVPDKIDISTRMHGNGCLDWTHSFAKRETIWRWCSLATTLASSNSSVGINFSEKVYEANAKNGVKDASPHQLENAIWVDGKVYVLQNKSPLIWTLGAKVWTIRSAQPTEFESIDLRIDLIGARELHLDAKVIVADFIQPHGTFHGSITATDAATQKTVSFTLDHNPVGVVEDHRAVW
eukprot:m.10711 g.10711  ORF g.10711 m.10711 type:complete len:416 (+) comp8445_c0_seq1:323-1570(+)